MHLVVRTKGDPLRLANAVQSAVWEIDADQPVSFVRTMEEVPAWAFAERRLTMQLLTVFAVLATLLSAIGIYGVISYAVSHRTQEVGIRMALGAQRHQVLALVLRQGLALAVLSILIGLGSAAAITRNLETMLFGVTPLDLWTFVVVSIVFGAVMLLASYVPARRATKVDPLVALRYE
jgi:putative ABC transport system permease protein